MHTTADKAAPDTADTSAERRARLREILEILNRHNIIAGLTPEKLCAILQDLGPTFVKLGQILSMRPDMIPAAYCTALQKLCADVAPMLMSEVRHVVESSLGVPLHQAFPRFDEQPLGSASIAQVHRATLSDGSSVVVKVQRENIHDKMKSDIGLLRKASGLMKLTGVGDTIDLGMVLDEMWVVSQEEMNFTTEAHNAEEFARLNADVTYVACPKIYRQYSTQQVLVMENIVGYSLEERAKLAALGYDMKEIGEKLCLNYMKQILDDGFFHADPHFGNLRIRDGQIVFIDLGMVGRLSARDQATLRKAVAAVVAHDTSALMDALLAIGKHSAPINREALFSDVDDMLQMYADMGIGDLDMGQMMQQLLELAKKHRISMPPGVTMLARGLCTLEGVVAEICPEVSPFEAMAQRFEHQALSDMDWKDELRRGGQAVYESARKSLNIPALVSDVLRLGQKGQLKLRVEAVAGKDAEQAAERHARMNRLCGLCGACFVGASILATADITPRVFGLPVAAVGGFVLAAALGGWLLWMDRKR